MSKYCKECGKRITGKTILTLTCNSCFSEITKRIDEYSRKAAFKKRVEILKEKKLQSNEIKPIEKSTMKSKFKLTAVTLLNTDENYKINLKFNELTYFITLKNGKFIEDKIIDYNSRLNTITSLNNGIIPLSNIVKIN